MSIWHPDNVLSFAPLFPCPCFRHCGYRIFPLWGFVIQLAGCWGAKAYPHRLDHHRNRAEVDVRHCACSFTVRGCQGPGSFKYYPCACAWFLTVLTHCLLVFSSSISQRHHDILPVHGGRFIIKRFHLVYSILVWECTIFMLKLESSHSVFWHEIVRSEDEAPRICVDVTAYQPQQTK